MSKITEEEKNKGLVEGALDDEAPDYSDEIGDVFGFKKTDDSDPDSDPNEDDNEPDNEDENEDEDDQIDEEDDDSDDDSEDDDTDENDEDDEEEEEGDIDSELELLREQNIALMQQINQLAGMKSGESGADTDDTEDNADSDKQDESDKNPFGLTEEELEEGLTDSNALLHLLNKVATNVKKDIIINLPDTVNKMVRQRTAIERVTEQFYKENKDLIPLGDYMGVVANQILSEEPGLSTKELLQKAGKRVREKLNLSKKVYGIHEEKKNSSKKKDSNYTPKKPGGSFKSGTKIRKKKVTELEQDIADTLELNK